MRLWGDQLLLHSPMPAHWYRPRRGNWALLAEVDLAEPRLARAGGVYIVWCRGVDPRVLRVGHGPIRETISASRRDPGVLARAKKEVLVTWAPIAARYRDGVVQYLADYYRPDVVDPVPNTEPIPVELP
jgi:hypothetical protein